MTEDTFKYRPTRDIFVHGADLARSCRSCNLWYRKEPDDTHGRCLNIANVARSEKFTYITGPDCSCSGYQRG